MMIDDDYNEKEAAILSVFVKLVYLLELCMLNLVSQEDTFGCL